MYASRPVGPAHGVVPVRAINIQYRARAKAGRVKLRLLFRKMGGEGVVRIGEAPPAITQTEARRGGHDDSQDGSCGMNSMAIAEWRTDTIAPH